MKHLPTSYETAALVLHLLKTYDDEKNKNSTRFRISRRSLRRISLRARLEDAFVDELFSELAGLGWAAFPIDDNIALVANTTVEDWPRIGTKDREVYTKILDDLEHGRTKKLVEVIEGRSKLILVDED
jgi:hypothetical protein